MPETWYRHAGLVEMAQRELGIHAESPHSLFSESTQSCCLKLEDGETGQVYVLKVFKPDYVHNSVQRVQDEFGALQRFSKALEGRQSSAMCPEPVAIFAEQRAYVMNFFHGQPVSAAVKSGRVRSSDVSHALVDAMAVFYADVGPLYGDFHYDNVLVGGDGRICLLDPMTSNDYYNQFGSREYRCGAGDIAYWAYSVCAHSLRQGMLAPFEHRFRMKFTVRLLTDWTRRLAPTAASEYLVQTQGVCDVLLRRLRSATLLRGKLLYSAGKIVQGLLFHAAHRMTRDTRQTA